MRPNKLTHEPITWHLETLYVCLTKGTNVHIAINSTRCWDNLVQRKHRSVKFFVLVDSENYDGFEQLPSYIADGQVPRDVALKKAK
jgi:hypothetical protein